MTPWTSSATRRPRHSTTHQRSTTRFAAVVRRDPLIVAAYTDELDCVALLGSPQWLAAEYRLYAGSRLLTVNTYGRGQRVSPDLIPGPAHRGRWASLFPIIAEFVSDNAEAIKRRKRAIGTRNGCGLRGSARKSFPPPRPSVRDARPLRNWKPAMGTGQGRPAGRIGF